MQPNLRSPRSLLAALSLAVLPAQQVPPPGLAHTAPSEVPITGQTLGDGAEMLSGRGGNMGLFTGPKGSLLVDTQYPEQAPAIRAALAERGIALPDYIVNTHWHPDHVGGNAALAGEATLIASPAGAKLMKNGGRLAMLNRDYTALPPEGVPSILTLGAIVDLGEGRDIHIFQVNAAGHSGTDLVVYDPNRKVMQTGDLFTNGAYPVVDTGHGGSLAGMISSIDALLKIGNGEIDTFIPGHGPLADRSDLVSFRDMLAELHNRICTAKGQGVAKEAYLASGPTTDLDAVWGQGFMKGPMLIAGLYDETECK